MGRYIVMDIVFYGNSLNYDQGTGNYQELKKITKWDGKQYTLVSRYALRYSLLETARKIRQWDIADGSKFQQAGEGDQTVIQPSEEMLLSGEILKYPEFDLFGYLITTTTPQNFREAPVKISHAISLTPFNYDALFNANIGLANRMRKIAGSMDPNPFTAEEHETYYQYSVVADLDRVGKIETYIKVDKERKENKKNYRLSKIRVEEMNGKLVFIGEYSHDAEKKEDKLLEFPVISERNDFEKVLVELPIEENKIEKMLQTNSFYEFRGNENVNTITIKYTHSKESVQNRIEALIRAILNLKRSIKGRAEDLSPKLMVVGIYKNEPYKTYKDKISLIDEYREEEYDEITEEPLENGRKIKVKHIVSKSKKPVFEVKVAGAAKEELSEDQVKNFINGIFNKSEGMISQVKVFYDPSVECKLT